jgi:hypothetical protein
MFRRARQVGAARRRRATRPEQRVTRFDLWREHLILEVAVGDPDLFRQREDLLRLGDIAGEWFLAGDAFQLALAAIDGVDDLLEVLDARLVGSRHPDCIDSGIGDHLGDRRIRSGITDVEVARVRGGGGRVLLVRAPDPEHVGVADTLHSAHVELRVEAAADESDAESLRHQPFSGRTKDFIRS